MAILWMDGFDQYHYEKSYIEKEGVTLSPDRWDFPSNDDNDNNYIENSQETVDMTIRSLNNSGYNVTSQGNYYFNRARDPYFLPGRKQGYCLTLFNGNGQNNYNPSPEVTVDYPLSQWQNNILNIGFAVNLQYDGTSGSVGEGSPFFNIRCDDGIVFELGYFPNTGNGGANIYGTTKLEQFQDEEETNEEGETIIINKDGYRNSEYTGFVDYIWNWCEVELDLIAEEVRVRMNSSPDSMVLHVGLNSISYETIRNSTVLMLGASRATNEDIRVPIKQNEDQTDPEDMRMYYRSSFTCVKSFDDFYVAQITESNDRVGNIQIYSRVPDEDVIKGFLNGTIDDPNYGFVNQLSPDFEESYVYGIEENATDLFKTTQELPDSDVYAVGVTVAGRRVGEEERRYMPLIRYNGTEELGDETIPDLLQYSTTQSIFENNPNTGNDWTSSEIVDIEFGYRLTR